MTVRRARNLLAGAAAVAAVAVAASVALAVQSADGKSVSTAHGVATTITLTGTSDLGVAAFNITGGPSHGALDLPVTGPMVCAASGGTFDCSADVLYTPTASYEGTDSFTYDVQDADGTSGDATVSIAVGSAPVAVDDPGSACGDLSATGGSFPIPEDWPDPFLFNGSCGLLSNDTDADTDPLTWAVATGPSHGTVQKVNESTFTYQPDPNFSTIAGNQPGGSWISDSFTYRANDGALDSAPASMKLWIAPINDPPTFTAGPSTVRVDEDSGAYSGAWATDISPGPANESAQTVHFEIVNVDLTGVPDLFSVAPSIDGAGTLAFTPGPNQFGLAMVTVRAVDNGGLEDYGVTHAGLPVPDDTSADVTFAIAVDPVVDSPVALGGTGTTSEDTAVDVNLHSTDADGDAVLFLVDDPVHGAVGYVGSPDCVAGDCTQQVTYTPDANYFGTDSFTFTTVKGLSTTSNTATVTVTVTSVNDAPSFTIGANQAVNEDSGLKTVSSWATSISAGPGESQTLTFVPFSDDNATLFAVAPAVSPSGTLTFTPAANANGTAHVTFKLHDNGGTANGGTDTSAGQTFTITITAVNDAPSFTPGPNIRVNQDSPAYTATGWATAISTGPANEVGQSISFSFTSDDNATLFAAGPAVASNGTLTFTPAAGRSGTAQLSLQAKDNGGTTNGGVDTSGSVSVTIRINANPNAVSDSVNVAENSPGTVMNLLANDTSLPDPPELLTITAVSNDSVLGPVHGSLTVALDGSSVTYVPTPGYYGSDFFRYYIADPYGGTDFATVFVTIVKDMTPPTVAPPAQRIRQGVALTSTTVLGLVTWSGSDAGVGIGHYELQRSTNGGAWTNVSLSSPTATTAYVAYPFGSTTYRFRVRGLDLNGNASAWLYTAAFHDARYEERNTALKYGGTWYLAYNSNDSGGAAKYTSVSGRSVTMTAKFRDIGVVTMKGPGRGSIAIYVDGVYKGTFSLVAATTRYRQVMWTAHYGLNTHTIRIVAVGNVRLDFDCFVTLY